MGRKNNSGADFSADTAAPPQADGGRPPGAGGDSTIAPMHLPPGEWATQRYRIEAMLGRGGMGEVYRAFDDVLRRHVALKVVRPEYASVFELNLRFVEEAQIAAQLDHPAIVPVHDQGRFPDGRLWMVMKEIHGRLLSDAFAAVHAASDPSAWRAAPDGTSFLRLLQALQRVSEAVGYAHSRGVVHRDLKPQNIMLGDFGEVYVMDWGLAKRVDRAETPVPVAVQTPARDAGLLRPTAYGQAVGTLHYMPPEQARGETHLVCAQSDVYALGAILHELLTGEPPPARIVDVGAGPAAFPAFAGAGRRPPPPLPPELVDLCVEAMAFRTSARPADGAAVARSLEAFLDGSARHRRAAEMLAQAEALAPRLESLRAASVEAAKAARKALGSLGPQATPEEKRPAWRLEDESEAAAIAARLVETDYLQRLRSAVALAPDLGDALAHLTRYHQRAFVDAEREGDRVAMAEHEAMLTTYGGEVFAAWLRGERRFHVETQPPGASVTCLRVVERDRRLELEASDAAPLMLRDDTVLSLGHGTHCLRIEHPEAESVDLYLQNRRALIGTPGMYGVQPVAVRLPPRGSIGPGEACVPAGRFSAGGDPLATDALSALEVDLPAFVICRDPVTVAEYRRFLDDLVEAHGELPPGLMPGTDSFGPGIAAAPFTLGPGGRFVHRDGAGADALPMTEVSWFAARAYAAWEARRTGLPWRLLTELEWEKAARGVDGRPWPWGRRFDPAWANCNGGARGVRLLPVGEPPGDVSPYGVRGMAGGVRTWCANAWTREALQFEPVPDGAEAPAFVSVRGGSWNATPEYCRPACRFAGLPARTYSTVGIRLGRGMV